MGKRKSKGLQGRFPVVASQAEEEDEECQEEATIAGGDVDIKSSVEDEECFDETMSNGGEDYEEDVEDKHSQLADEDVDDNEDCDGEGVDILPIGSGSLLDASMEGEEEEEEQEEEEEENDKDPANDSDEVEAKLSDGKDEAAQMLTAQHKKVSVNNVDFSKYFRAYASQLNLSHAPTEDLSIVINEESLVIVSIREMLHDRGLTAEEIPSEQEMLVTLEDSEDDVSFQIEGRLYLVFLRGEKFGVSKSRGIVSSCPVGIESIIVVSKRQPTSQARKELQAACSNCGSRMSLFIYSELLRPYIRHHSVPQHTAVGADEEVSLLKRLCCTKSNLPLLMVDSPVARWYGWSVGTIVHIERRFGGYNQTSDFWRVVSKS